MIYLAVRLARNSAATAAASESSPLTASLPKESDLEEANREEPSSAELIQFWLHPSEQGDREHEPPLLEEEFDDGRVQWFRSPRISYKLRNA